VVAPDGGWRVEFFENTDEDVEAGDIVIYSELALPAKPEYGAGSMTKRINTRRMAGELTASQKYEEQLPETKEMEAYATIEYEDQAGRQTYRMAKNQIVIGRGGRDYWTDLKLTTLPDVSREHVRLRRDAESGEFFIKDLSRLGTSVNGEQIPTSVEFVDGEKRDKNVEVKLPATARIGLADVVFLDFSDFKAPPTRSLRCPSRPTSDARARAMWAWCGRTTKTACTSTRTAASSW
jgi:hypothetical protein